MDDLFSLLAQLIVACLLAIVAMRYGQASPASGRPEPPPPTDEEWNDEWWKN